MLIHRLSISVRFSKSDLREKNDFKLDMENISEHFTDNLKIRMTVNSNFIYLEINCWLYKYKKILTVSQLIFKPFTYLNCNDIRYTKIYNFTHNINVKLLNKMWTNLTQ